MRFSIQEQDQPKQFFHSISAAQKETSLPNAIIKSTLERTNPRYHRKSDGKIFFIQKEPQIRIFTIEGEDFFSLEEIQEKFGLSQTKFLNQVKKETFPKKIDWISPEIFSPGEKNEVEPESPQKKEPPIPLPRTEKVFLDLPQTEVPPQGIKPPPPEVVEIRKTGETFPFVTSKQLSISTFISPTTVAAFIKSGIKGKLFFQGAKKNQTIIWDEKLVFLPDLVKEIIAFHIRDQIWKDGDKKQNKAMLDALMDYNNGKKKLKDMIHAIFIAKVRRLDEDTINDICKELMKFL